MLAGKAWQFHDTSRCPNATISAWSRITLAERKKRAEGELMPGERGEGFPIALVGVG